MKFGTLRQRVERAEFLVEGRAQETRLHWSELRRTWRAGWSPLRIMTVGFGLGFVTGRNEPQAALGSIASKLGGIPKLLQMISNASLVVGYYFGNQTRRMADGA